jgi:hypothetical protein
MSTHSYQSSPSRRGRRIFDFGNETLIRAAQQGINPFANSSQPNTPVLPPVMGNCHLMLTQTEFTYFSHSAVWISAKFSSRGSNVLPSIFGCYDEYEQG